MHFIVVNKRFLLLFSIFCLAAAAGALWIVNRGSVSVLSQQSEGKIREIHMVTGEFKSRTDGGKEIEAYRWDPGTIFLKEGEHARLIISGINGTEHPFMIEGTSIKGIVKKGEETVVPLQFEKEGVYRLICMTHQHKKSNGPMIAYIVVD
ncbi:hypothetical protein [Bacillus sp. T33-2]|uniref:hypothetical protein n=1 Tax=Bacillus sp. T33-2 TaxID=2054168 RepID=UPI000C771721|nr:hypothetical protein [Bacillus sp. T33-2]PLR98790.1 hypothetical protein CVD19_03895 [Bacillus sp. T33-2]